MPFATAGVRAGKGLVRVFDADFWVHSEMVDELF